MSTCLNRGSTWGRGESPFDRVIAFEVYDGPTTGVAFCKGGDDAVLFRLLAWDESQVMRVFGLAPLPAQVGTRLLEALTNADHPQWPEWWLKRSPAPEAARAVDQAVSEVLDRGGQTRWVVVTEDLLGGSARLARIVEGAHRQEFERLSRRGSPDSEVSEGSFADWLRFVEDTTTPAEGGDRSLRN